MPNMDMTNTAVEEGITRHAHLWAQLMTLLSSQVSRTGVGYQGFRIEEAGPDGEFEARISSRYMDVSGQVFEFTEIISLGFMYGPVNAS